MVNEIRINGPERSVDVKVIKNTASGEGVQLNDDNGLSIQNTSGSNAVTLTASGAAELTVGGAITASQVTSSGLTSGRLTYASSAGLLQDSADLTWTDSDKRLGIGASSATVTDGRFSPKIDIRKDVNQRLLLSMVNPNTGTGAGSAIILGGADDLSQAAYIEYLNSNFDAGSGITGPALVIACTDDVKIDSISRDIIFSTTGNLTAGEAFRVINNGAVSFSKPVDVLNTLRIQTTSTTVIDGRFDPLLDIHKDENKRLLLSMINTDTGTSAGSAIILGEAVDASQAAYIEYLNSNFDAGNGITGPALVVGCTSNVKINSVSEDIIFSTTGNLTTGEALRIINNGSISISKPTLISSLTSGRVTYAGTSGLLQDSSNLTFNGTTLSTQSVHVTGTTGLYGTGNQLQIGPNNVGVGAGNTLLFYSDGDVFFTLNDHAGASHLYIRGDDGSNQSSFDSLGNLIVANNLTVTGSVSGSLKVSALTSGRVTYAGTAGELQDSANLTYNGTTFATQSIQVTTGTTGLYGSSGQLQIGPNNVGFAGPQTLLFYGNGNTYFVLNDHAGASGLYIRADDSSTESHFDSLGNLTVANNIIATNTLTAAHIKDSALTSGRVTYAGTAGELQDSANLTYNGTTFATQSIQVTTGTTGLYGSSGQLQIGPNNVGFAGPQTLLFYGNGNTYFVLNDHAGASGLYIRADDTSTESNFDSLGNLNIANTLTAAHIKDSALTSGRVTFASTSGLLTDSSNLTFDGTYLTANSIKDSALTSGQVVFAGASGLLTDSSDLTFDGTYLTANSIKDTALTSSRVTYAGPSGLLQDSAKMTFTAGHDQSAPIHYGDLLNGGGSAPYLDGADHVFVRGNYAYVTSFTSSALEIINISNPAAPVHAGSLLDGGGSAPYLNEPVNISVVGNYAYIASFGSNALEIIDISNPAVPVHVGALLDGGGSAPYLNQPYGIFVSGNYAYIVSYNSSALEIVDISTPSAPVHVGSLLDGGGAAPYLNNPQSIYVQGNYAYIASASSNALEVVDVSNPASPVHVGSLLDGGGVAPYLNGPLSVFVVGNYAYVSSNNSNALEVVDISNPALPAHTGSLLDGGDAAPYLDNPFGVFVSGNYAYIATSGSNALEIVDISTPATPTHFGSLLDGAGGAVLNSARGVVIQGNYAYIASSAALEIVQVFAPADFSLNGDLNATGNASLGGLLNLNNNVIINVADPVNSGDAVNKSYADSLRNGIQWKEPVDLATTAALPAYTSAGTGVGKTLTANANGLLVIDGTNASVNDRVLVKDETGGNDFNNGIYVVTAAGDGSNPWILTRSTDADTDPEVLSGMAAFVNEGTVNVGKGFVLTTPDPITLDTTGLLFVQFAALVDQTPTPGDGITVNVTEVSVRADTTSGIQSIIVNAGVAPSGIAIKFNPAGALSATSSGAGINVDNSTIVINSDALEVPPGGITDTQLANSYIKANGSVQLSSDWNAGSFNITSQNFTDTSLTSGRVTYAGTSGLLTDSADLTFDGTTLTAKAAVVLSTDTGVSFQDGNGSPIEGMKLRVVSAITTDATVTEIKVDGNSLTLADNTAHTYVAHITARCTGGGAGNSGLAAYFKIEVLATAAGGVATIIPNPIKFTTNQRDGVWDVSVTSTSNKVQFNAIGDTNDHITWAGWIQETTIS